MLIFSVDRPPKEETPANVGELDIFGLFLVFEG